MEHDGLFAVRAVPEASPPMLVLLYGVTCYLLGVSALLGWIAAMFGVLPFNVAPVEYSPTTAYLAAGGLMIAFGVQHSVMARASFKRWLTGFAPQAAERPTFVLATAIVLWALLLLWPSLPSVIWKVEDPQLRTAITGLGAVGFAYLFVATFAINHFELFGLQQVYSHFKGASIEPVPFRERLMYRFDRHPIMTGALVGSWATPEMTLDHLLFAAMLTAYIVVGVSIEERDLRRNLGEIYRTYAARVRTIVPTFRADRSRRPGADASLNPDRHADTLGR
jgi:protein-S-isoprenylcysteine O-methyltransferase Ste14